MFADAGPSSGRASAGGRRLLGRVLLAVAVAIILLATTGLVAIVLVLASEPVDVTRSRQIPAWLERQSRRDALAYPIHSALGTAFNAVGGSPLAAGVQWFKAAAHARTADEVERAAHGISIARERDAADRTIDATLCAANVRSGAYATQVAAMGQAGLPCGTATRAEARAHVPRGTRVVYASRPPTSGPHDADWHGTYGLVDRPPLPGVWLHNLEHGAVVLLYNCPSTCPDLVSGLSELYLRLPFDPNANMAAPRLLIVPYTDMDHRIAVVAWDRLVELDEFDARAISDFYASFVNRGPECVSFQCPD
jgi:hypothetical protein